MRIDSVLFIMDVEKTFGVYIAQHDLWGLTTPRHLIDYLADRLSAQGWTRPQIAGVVHKLIKRTTGLSPGEYTEDSQWSRDMGID